MDGADRFSAGLIVRLAGTEREVNAECDPRQPIAALVDAIRNEVGLPAGGDLYVVRTGRRLERDRPLTSQPLAHGEILSPEPHMRPSLDARYELVGAGGVALGSRWPLVDGRQVVGRSRDCEVVVDDPALSRVHLSVRIESDGVLVGDAGSTNGTFIGGVRLDGEHRLQPDEVIEAGASLFTVDRVGEREGGRAPDSDGYIRFNRPPRVASGSPPKRIAIPPPPSPSSTPRLPLASAALPLIAALALWRLFPDNPGLLLIVALSPLMALFSVMEERRRGSGAARSEEDGWRRALTETLRSVEAERASAIRVQRNLAPSVHALEAAAESQTPDLWLRRPNDPDLLLLRWGWGDRRWDEDVTVGAGGSDALREEAQALLDPLLTLPSVPLTVPLGKLGVIGLAGDAPRVSDLIRWWLIQLATLHSPEDVSVALLVQKAEADEWRWTTWLPHCPNEPTEGTLRPAAEQLQAVLNLLEVRQQGRSDAPRVVAIVDERTQLPRSLTSRLVREGPQHGIHVVWHANRREDLPGECAAIVELDDDGAALTIVDSAERIAGAFEGITAETARRVATALAPLRDAAPRSASDALPGRLALFDALEVERPEAGWVTSRWRRSDAGSRAPVGRSAEGPYEFDLIEDGPHALVGGTTGSGKSELLQTIVAALAVTYPPSHLNFLLVDYKGGAAFKDCERFPHTVGSVTDLDAHLANRALISLDAEVRRRETLLRGAGARDLTELIAAGHTVPRLVLLVDEFATLIKELPDFVDGVVDLAQRGRSLGIHVVLATQRPAGVINDAIRANTNLRIALRMADEADSENVIGTKEAAHIPRSIPGRAYARTGHAEVEEIQCAYGGTRGRGPRPVLVWDRTSGSPPSEDASSGPTQLEQLVPVLEAAARTEGLSAPKQLWLPPLPDALGFSDLEPPPGESRVALLGLTDRPEVQRREVAAFAPEKDGGLVVFGTGRSGKTTVLRTIAASLAGSAPVDRVHVYGIDHAGAGLQALRSLPHVGDVIGGDEPERVERLFHRLRAEVDRRRTALKAGSSDRPPTIVVLLDGYAGFAATFERVDMGALVDGLPALVTEGRSLGIHFVITAERRAALPQAPLSAIGRRLVLRLADADEYAALGLDARKLHDAALPPGRGYIDGHEIQVATPSGTRSPAADEQELLRIAQTVPPGAAVPPGVPMLPLEVTLAGLTSPGTPFRAVLGLVESDDLLPGVVDLGPAHFLAAGPYRSGRSTALATLVASLRATTPGASFHLLAPRRTPLSELSGWARVAEGADTCTAYIEMLSSALAEDPDGPRIVVIDDAEELLDGPASYSLEPLIRRARDASTRFVVAGETKALHRAFTGWISEVRKDKQGLLLDPDPDVDGDLFGVRLPRRRATTSPGRGYLISRGAIEPIQVARA